MIDWIIDIDKDLFLYLNHLRANWMDPVMLFLSAKKVWIPLYLLILGLIAYHFRKKAIILILGLILSVVAADQITSGFMKPFFKRPRPCHEVTLAGQVLTPGKCGGQFGYASSHAANTFAVAAFMFFLFRKEKKYRWILFGWAALVSYSRVYLGVHYPLDIITGALIGTGCGYVLLSISHQLNGRLIKTST